MSTNLTLAARLHLDNQRWGQSLNQSRTQTRGFVAGVKREFADLKGFMSSTVGKITSLAGGITLAGQMVNSAGMDKALTRIGQTAGASQAQVKGLRGELFRMGGETGRLVGDLQSGFDTLIAGGLTFGESLPTLNAINKTMAVTGAQAETLAGTLGVAGTAFQFDLSQPDAALTLLDKMTVAGRQGNAELESLGSIFSRVGTNAAGAGFGFEQTLAFIEGLSMIERAPERLATLADSTLRLFTNANYMKDAQKATGIKFFDKEGGRRDPLLVLADLKKRMDAFKTDAQREGFLAKAFGGADLDTIKGLRTLLQGNSLDKINGFTREITNASGTIERDLPEAIANAVDQTGRLKAKLAEAADNFAQKINAPLSSGINKLLTPKSEGGMGVTGNQMIAGGAGALALAFLGRKLPGKLGSMLGGGASLGTGVAMGTALEKAGAATPVFVVGAAPGLFSGGGGGVGGALGGAAGGAAAGGAARKFGTAALLRAGAMALGGASVTSLAGAGAAGVGALAGGAAGAGAAGYGVGTGIYHLSNQTQGGRNLMDKTGEDIAKLLAFLGNDAARQALESNKKMEVSIMLDDLRSKVVGVRLNGRDTSATVGIGNRGLNLGRMMQSPGIN